VFQRAGQTRLEIRIAQAMVEFSSQELNPRASDAAALAFDTPRTKVRG
jgi:hypothetical protein